MANLPQWWTSWFNRWKLARANRPRIFIVPTRYGFFFGIWALLFLIGSWLHANQPALVVGACLVTFGLTAMHLTHLNLAHLQLKQVHLEPGFAGETSLLQIRSDNSLKTPLATLEIEGSLVDIPSGLRWLEGVPFRLERRGKLTLKSIKIASVFPFGLFYAWTYWEGELTTSVYPPRNSSSNPFLSGSLVQDFGSGCESEFSGHRLSLPGDPARKISWKQLAKTGKLVTRYYDREADLPVLLNWKDARGANDEEKLSYLSTIVDQCRQAQRPVGLSLPQGEVSPDSTPESYRACLELLATYGGACSVHG